MNPNTLQWEDWFRSYPIEEVRRRARVLDAEAKAELAELEETIGHMYPQIVHLAERLDMTSSLCTVHANRVAQLAGSHVQVGEFIVPEVPGLGLDHIRGLLENELASVVEHGIVQKQYLRAARVVYLGKVLDLDVAALDASVTQSLLGHLEAGLTLTPNTFHACLIQFGCCAGDFVAKYLDICLDLVVRRLHSFDAKAFETVDRTMFIYNSIAFDLAQSRLSKQRLEKAPEIADNYTLKELLSFSPFDAMAFPDACYESISIPSLDPFLDAVSKEFQRASAQKFASASSAAELTSMLALFVRQVQHALNDSSMARLLVACEPSFANAFLKLTRESTLLHTRSEGREFSKEKISIWLQAVKDLYKDLEELDTLGKSTRSISTQFARTLYSLKDEASVLITEGVQSVYHAERGKWRDTHEGDNSVEELAEVLSAIGTLDAAARELRVQQQPEPVSLYKLFFEKLQERVAQGHAKPKFGGKTFGNFDLLLLLDALLDKDLWTEKFVQQLNVICSIPVQSRLIFQPLRCDGPEELNFDEPEPDMSSEDTTAKFVVEADTSLTEIRISSVDETAHEEAAVQPVTLKVEGDVDTFSDGLMVDAVTTGHGGGISEPASPHTVVPETNDAISAIDPLSSSPSVTHQEKEPENNVGDPEDHPGESKNRPESEPIEQPEDHRDEPKDPTTLVEPEQKIQVGEQVESFGTEHAGIHPVDPAENGSRIFESLSAARPVDQAADEPAEQSTESVINFAEHTEISQPVKLAEDHRPGLAVEQADEPEDLLKPITETPDIESAEPADQPADAEAQSTGYSDDQPTEQNRVADCPAEQHVKTLASTSTPHSPVTNPAQAESFEEALIDPETGRQGTKDLDEDATSGADVVEIDRSSDVIIQEAVRLPETNLRDDGQQQQSSAEVVSSSDQPSASIKAGLETPAGEPEDGPEDEPKTEPEDESLVMEAAATSENVTASSLPDPVYDEGVPIVDPLYASEDPTSVVHRVDFSKSESHTEFEEENSPEPAAPQYDLPADVADVNTGVTQISGDGTEATNIEPKLSGPESQQDFVAVLEPETSGVVPTSSLASLQIDAPRDPAQQLLADSEAPPEEPPTSGETQTQGPLVNSKTETGSQEAAKLEGSRPSEILKPSDPDLGSEESPEPVEAAATPQAQAADTKPEPPTKQKPKSKKKKGKKGRR